MKSPLMDLPCVLVLNTLQTWLKDLVRKSSYCQDLCTIYFTYKPFVLEGYDTTERVGKGEQGA